MPGYYLIYRTFFVFVNGYISGKTGKLVPGTKASPVGVTPGEARVIVVLTNPEGTFKEEVPLGFKANAAMQRAVESKEGLSFSIQEVASYIRN